MLTKKQVDFYWKHGFLHILKVFSQKETDELAEHLDWMMRVWGSTRGTWTGPWRKKLMDEETEKESELFTVHGLEIYSDAWMRAVTNPRLVAVVRDLIGPNVELHHTTMHVKPPETGQPFPLHQDYPFYPHRNPKFVDVLVHLDDTCHENGEIRFLDGSHKLGPLKHIIEAEEGPCSPHLPLDEYRLEDTVPVPVKRGDVVLFNIHTIHGSYVNTTDRPRRLVRVGYRDPENIQVRMKDIGRRDEDEGSSFGRPGLLVSGIRPRASEQRPFYDD